MFKQITTIRLDIKNQIFLHVSTATIINTESYIKFFYGGGGRNSVNVFRDTKCRVPDPAFHIVYFKTTLRFEFVAFGYRQRIQSSQYKDPQEPQKYQLSAAPPLLR